MIIGAKVRPSRRGRVRWARESTGGWGLSQEMGRGVFQLSGMTFGGKRVHRDLQEAEARALRSVGKVRQRRADAGLMKGGGETRRRAAIRRLWEKRTWRGGRHDSADRMGRGVDLKQLGTHLWTCLQ